MPPPGIAPRKVTLLPLIAATYFMVSGGPYGLEDVLARAGYPGAILALLLTPILWSLPTALLASELTSALAVDGGYYAWVRRALGPFWGFQEAWLSLAASVFDMAIYPTLFVLYLGKLAPGLGHGGAAILVGAALIGACSAANILGARVAGDLSVGFGVVLLAPFAALAAIALFPSLVPAPSVQPAQGAAPAGGLLAGMMIAMWNYMGFDNASTIAGEVDRPQRTYPLAMIGTVALIAATYLAPVLAIRARGVDVAGWSTGAWVDAARALGGPGLGLAVVVGGMICGAGMLNALILSYSRVPMALALDGYLPSIFARLHPRTGAPWVAILACGAAYTLCLGLGFERLIELDVLLYGLSLALEFIALVALRLREPNLPRPFRVPGGLAGAILLGVPPMALLALAVRDAHAAATGGGGFLIPAAVVAAGPLLYRFRARRRVPAVPC